MVVLVVQFHLKIRLTKDEENLKDDMADNASRVCIEYRKGSKFKFG